MSAQVLAPQEAAQWALASHIGAMAREMLGEPHPNLNPEQTRRELDRAILRAAHAVACGKEPRP